MKKDSKPKRPLRLAADDLRRSRAGMLGRFPAEDLYEPERAKSKDDHEGEAAGRDERPKLRAGSRA